MADTKISALSDGGVAQATDEFIIARSGVNYRVDGAEVAAAATSVGTLTSLTVSGNTYLNSSSGNVGIGTSTFGTSAAKVLAIKNGTAPTTGPADTVQLYSVDLSAGNTIPAIYCEGSGVTGAATTDVAVTTKIAIKVNGTVYYLLATTSAD